MDYYYFSFIVCSMIALTFVLILVFAIWIVRKERLQGLDGYAGRSTAGNKSNEFFH